MSLNEIHEISRFNASVRLGSRLRELDHISNISKQLTAVGNTMWLNVYLIIEWQLSRSRFTQQRLKVLNSQVDFIFNLALTLLLKYPSSPCDLRSQSRKSKVTRGEMYLRLLSSANSESITYVSHSHPHPHSVSYI